MKLPATGPVIWPTGESQPPRRQGHALGVLAVRPPHGAYFRTLPWLNGLTAALRTRRTRRSLLLLSTASLLGQAVLARGMHLHELVARGRTNVGLGFLHPFA